MVSFQSPSLQLNQRKTILESDNISKKRKWDHDLEANEILPYKQWMSHKSVTAAATTTTTNYFSNIELSLEIPTLPSEWQRCLDIQSGEIYFYNTRTQKRTLRDPREEQEQETSHRNCHMSLDLQLNLPCGSLNNNNNNNNSNNSSSNYSQEIKHMTKTKPQKAPRDLFKSLSNGKVDDHKKGSTENSNDDHSSEMVAAACMKCHMLVVLQKSAPTCPNCKFVHPPYQTPSDLFKAKLSLSC